MTTPQQAAHDTRDVIAVWTAGFIVDGATFEYGAKLGFDGVDFYMAGRGGALGDVPADVVVAAFAFFEPETVRAAWNRAAKVMPPRDAALEWAGCAHRWARDHVPDEIDLERVNGYLGRVVSEAAVFGAPVFAGWRTLPEPEDAPALLVHRLNALRELRGGLHVAAVLTVGLTPHEAVSVLTPHLAAFLGWTEPAADPAPLKERWQLAEARTDRMFGRHLAVLDASERIELVEQLGRLNP